MKELAVDLTVIVATLAFLTLGIVRAVNAEPLTVKPAEPTQALHVTNQTRGQLDTVNPQTTVDGYELQPASSKGL